MATENHTQGKNRNGSVGGASGRRQKSRVVAKGVVGGVGLSALANVGPATLGDFKVLGIKTPTALARSDKFELYNRLCDLTNTRQDPREIDVFRTAVGQA